MPVVNFSQRQICGIINYKGFKNLAVLAYRISLLDTRHAFTHLSLHSNEWCSIRIFKCP